MNPPVTPPPLPTLPPLEGIGAILQALLREPERLWSSARSGSPYRIFRTLLGVLLAGAVLYGLVVGSFSGGAQWWAAPLKIASGLLLSAAICLPSLFVFACLSGIEIRVSDTLTALAGMLALEMVLLASFGPVAWVFSQSTESVAVMGFLHLLFWAVASVFGIRLLNAGLASHGTRSGAPFLAWAGIFVLVSLQMMTALRPIVGKSDQLLPTEKRFFLEHWGEVLKARP